jgi:hypothetical protein
MSVVTTELAVSVAVIEVVPLPDRSPPKVIVWLPVR